jgi:hypothetical protein
MVPSAARTLTPGIAPPVTLVIATRFAVPVASGVAPLPIFSANVWPAASGTASGYALPKLRIVNRNDVNRIVVPGIRHADASRGRRLRADCAT